MTPLVSLPLQRRLEALAGAQYLLVCSDYDGTLAPLAPRPEQAQPLLGVVNLLHKLAHLPRTRIAIISGRGQDNLRTHSGLDLPVLLVGSHGAELPGQAAGKADADMWEDLTALVSVWEAICATAPGAWIERKPMGIALHVRNASMPVAEHVLAEVRSSLRAWPKAHVTEGKAVIEVSLSPANKGDAVRWLRNDWGVASQTLFFGDDLTDEAGFQALGTGDIGVKIGAGPTCAEYSVESERAVLSILTDLWTRRASINSATEAPCFSC
jgi:trehalose 6-phosphate phosphatase